MIHTGARPFRCPHQGCDADFNRAEHLRHHLLVHKGDRPYVCKFRDCGSSFTCSSHLLRHYRIHTGERPHRCTHCSASFITKNHLKIHELSHTGERPHVCEYPGCGATLARVDHLARHVLRWHSEDGQMRHKRQEQRVAAFLDRAGIRYRREHRIEFDCCLDHRHDDQERHQQQRQEQEKDNDDDDVLLDDKRGKKCARVDFLIIHKSGVIFLEVDEGQHRFGEYSVSCDMGRMAKIIESLTLGGNSMPVLFIRYNPDAYSCSVTGHRTVSKRCVREARLQRVIEEWIPNADVPLTIQYMYYDVDSVGDLKVLQYPDYHPLLESCCLRPIY